MNYYLCIMIPYENTDITCYDTLEELKKDLKNYKTLKKDDYYIIKGIEIEL